MGLNNISAFSEITWRKVIRPTNYPYLVQTDYCYGELKSVYMV